jgi:hypothetical protein
LRTQALPAPVARAEGRLARGGQPENDKVGRSCVERRAELAGLDALIDGEMKLAQRLSQKLSNVVLTIGNADMWHGRSVL